MSSGSFRLRARNVHVAVAIADVSGLPQEI